MADHMWPAKPKGFLLGLYLQSQSLWVEGDGLMPRQDPTTGLLAQTPRPAPPWRSPPTLSWPLSTCVTRRFCCQRGCTPHGHLLYPHSCPCDSEPTVHLPALFLHVLGEWVDSVLLGPFQPQTPGTP
jgi:hypothetical protein